MLRIGGHAAGVAPARPRAVLLRGLAGVAVMAKRLQVGVGVGAAILQPIDVIHFGCLGHVTTPQALGAKRMVPKLACTDGPPPTPDCARRGCGHDSD